MTANSPGAMKPANAAVSAIAMKATSRYAHWPRAWPRSVISSSITAASVCHAAAPATIVSPSHCGASQLAARRPHPQRSANRPKTVGPEPLMQRDRCTGLAQQLEGRVRCAARATRRRAEGRCAAPRSRSCSGVVHRGPSGAQARGDSGQLGRALERVGLLVDAAGRQAARAGQEHGMDGPVVGAPRVPLPRRSRAAAADASWLGTSEPRPIASACSSAVGHVRSPTTAGAAAAPRRRLRTRRRARLKPECACRSRAARAARPSRCARGTPRSPPPRGCGRARRGRRPRRRSAPVARRRSSARSSGTKIEQISCRPSARAGADVQAEVQLRGRAVRERLRSSAASRRARRTPPAPGAPRARPEDVPSPRAPPARGRAIPGSPVASCERAGQRLAAVGERGPDQGAHLRVGLRARGGAARRARSRRAEAGRKIVRDTGRTVPTSHASWMTTDGTP